MHHECKPCKLEYQKKRADRNREYISTVLREAGGCVDCGHNDLRVLEFDHVRGTKTGNIGDMMSQGHKLDKLKAEIAKCEVVCANCHKIRTYTRRGDTYRDRIS